MTLVHLASTTPHIEAGRQRSNRHTLARDVFRKRALERRWSSSSES